LLYIQIAVLNVIVLKQTKHYSLSLIHLDIIVL